MCYLCDHLVVSFEMLIECLDENIKLDLSRWRGFKFVDFYVVGKACKKLLMFN